MTDHKPDASREEILEVMARAIEEVDWDDPQVMARSALSALEHAGYVVTKVSKPLTDAERESIVGITDVMRGIV